MKLITELFDEVSFITEERDGKKINFILGPCVESEIKNRNGRLYPQNILEREVDRYVTEKVKTGGAMGELGHPAGPQLNLDRVSHIFTEVKRDGSKWIGKARLTETPTGQIARGLLESGARIGFSSRGLGSLKYDKNLGAEIVQEDYRLAVLSDIVADPSAPNCFVRGIMEGADWILNERTGEWVESVRADLRKKTVRQIDEESLEVFSRFLESLSGIPDLSEGKRNKKKGDDSTAAKWARAKKRAAKEGKDHDYSYVRSLFGKV